MKKRVLKLTALILIVSVFAVFVPMTSAVAPELGEYDQMMLTAFWHQEAYDGMNNGEAVYDIHLGEGGDLEHPAPTYDGGYWTHLLDIREEDGETKFMFFKCTYTLGGWDGFKTVPVVTVRPDLYGKLDLHGVSLRYLYPPEPGQTHITAVDVNGCEHLGAARFSGQEYCESLTALECPRLYWVEALNGAFKNIDFSPRDFDEDVHIDAFGNGTVGTYLYWLEIIDTEDFKLYAYPGADNFVGWYKNGELVSTDLMYNETEGGRFTACFGGDTDDDGDITSTDALLTLRSALGIGEDAVDPAMADIDGDGLIDTTDALMILRFALCII